MYVDRWIYDEQCTECNVDGNKFSNTFKHLIQAICFLHKDATVTKTLFSESIVYMYWVPTVLKCVFGMLQNKTVL